MISRKLFKLAACHLDQQVTGPEDQSNKRMFNLVSRALKLIFAFSAASSSLCLAMDRYGTSMPDSFLNSSAIQSMISDRYLCRQVRIAVGRAHLADCLHSDEYQMCLRQIQHDDLFFFFLLNVGRVQRRGSLMMRFTSRSAIFPASA